MTEKIGILAGLILFLCTLFSLMYVISTYEYAKSEKSLECSEEVKQ